ncbi:DUF885 domain-containing protein [Sphingomonas sp. AX6]|uniref:DUF885 domain-containing protein n=1 Tax=Sphingomonas sp. AX6 TaxID=2653171 RepID=UPI0012EF7650|nr:DUF885 family protein [Sphingomonas sp. AX6]VXC41341.1 conserved exported hypothetical protein [Sphingomonas sp. AX6]
MLIRTLPLAALVFALPATAQTAADTQFRAIADAEWTWRQSEGIGGRAPGTVRDNIPDVSATAQARRLAKWEATLKQLDGIDPTTLSTEDAVNYGVYRQQIEALIDDQRALEWQKPLNSDSAFWSNLQFSARGDFAGGEKDYRAYLSMLGDIGTHFDQQIANMDLGLARGFTPPKIVMQGRDASVEAIANATDPTRTVYWQPFATLPASMPEATRNQLQDQARARITQTVIPAHKKLLTYLRGTYFPGMRDGLAATGYEDGAEYYASRIRVFTTTDMTADQIHQLGLSEVARIRARMEIVKAEAGFSGDLAAFLTFLKTDPQFYATTPEQLLKEAAWHSQKFDNVASRWFGRMPRSRVSIKPVPDDIAPFYTAGRGGAGGYLVNTYDLPSRPLYSLPALTLHEADPGHHWQATLSAENDALPEWRRYTYISAFGEGWGLYAEALGEEMGMYTTPYELFGMLSYQMWRAARLVVDTGIHTKGWSRDRALAFMRDNTALSDHEVTTEIDRYIGWPGQALSYYIGQLAIQRERARAEKALGAKFAIRAFHDTVLSLGSVPLPVLTQRIDRFIAEGGVSPWGEAE